MFLDPHVSFGQVSGIEPPSLALRLPLPVVSRMALMGRHERLSARRLYELGLVTELVEEGSLVDRAVEIARVVASASPAAVRATRRSWRRLSDGMVEPAMREGWDDVQKHWSHPDAAEGAAALRDKRPARWTL
jgi:enoyl-CoA hydratase/carnithine racemase